MSVKSYRRWAIFLGLGWVALLLTLALTIGLV